MSDKLNWKNRIIGHGEKPASWFLANEKNWRIHPMNQQNALKGTLSEVGWVQEVIVNKRTGEEWGENRGIETLIDGHLRVTLALREGDETPIPVKYVDLSEEEENLILASLDPIAAMAATDKTKLDDLLQNIQSDDERIIDLLNEISEKENLEFGKKELIEDVEPQIDKAEELRVKWGVQTGQLWELGNHRLVCGDCTDKAVVERVLQGEKYNVLTDPPYNIGFNYESIDDKMTDENYSSFCSKWFNNIVPNAIGSIFSPGPKNVKYYPEPRDRGYWIKRNATAGASCFHLRLVEPLLFYGKFNDKRNTDLFEYSSGFTNELSEARKQSGIDKNYAPAKSMPLWEELVSMFSDGVILDVFIGNGTSILACERLNRKCRAIEISPAYCAVAIQRWVDMTGKEPKLLTKSTP